MASRAPPPDSEAAEFADRKDAACRCDLHQVFDRTTTSLVESLDGQNTPISLNLCPELRAPRLIAPQAAADLFRTVVLAAAALSCRGGVTVLADGVSTEVSVAVGAIVDSSTPIDHPVLRLAAATARDGEAELTIRIAGDRLTLSLIIPAPLAPPSVLLVEKDELQRAQLHAALLAAGFTVESATGAEAVLRLLASGPYAAVLIDLQEREADALALARTARGAHPDAAVFALASESAAACRHDLDRAGFTRLIRKPFSAERLRALIGR